ncbi:MAG TPA: hypothetical protein VI357_08205 [Mycobacteriales bacterium]
MTYSVWPRRSRPSPLVSEAPPRSTCRVTPVRAETRNSSPVLDCTMSSVRPFGLATMPLALKPGA